VRAASLALSGQPPSTRSAIRMSYLQLSAGRSPSFCRRGNCYDNAVAEIFFHLLKSEPIRRKTYATREEACQDIFNYIELFYNPKRKHGKNGLLSPIDYERQQKMKLQGV
jgi:putative transposase